MKRPLRFAVLAVVMAMIAWNGVVALLQRAPADGPKPLLGTAMGIAELALLLVTADALWRMRPWCTRAFAALSCAVVARMLVTLDAGGEDLGLIRVVWIALVGAFLAGLVAVVHDRAETLFGPSPPKSPPFRIRRAPPTAPVPPGTVRPPHP
jgi:hypothetical protein